MLLWFFFIAILTVILDQISKNLVFYFQPDFRLGILTIHFVQNTGAGFGILEGQTIGLAIVSLIVALLVIFYYKKIPPEKLPQTLFAVFLGGVIGNLIDRLLRGYVVDFIDFSFWPAFNAADASICVAVAGLIIYYWKK